jgi:hypothetical protein
MKYFTSELIARGQADDEQSLEEQDRLWEEAADRYVRYLDTIRPAFPAGLRQIDTSYYLHDAEVLGMGHDGRTFGLALRLDTPPRSLLTFTYDLVSDPVIDREALTPECRFGGGSVLWQYNEIEQGPGDPPTWVESILFSNGWEVCLHFRDIKVQELQAILPPSRNEVPGILAR